MLFFKQWLKRLCISPLSISDGEGLGVRFFSVSLLAFLLSVDTVHHHSKLQRKVFSGAMPPRPAARHRRDGR